MLDAAGDPYRPYLLVLDEMNLAHVERYFADVLSGIETDDDCLPNLRDEGGSWRIPMAGPERRVVPRNLIVVGTVNVDETTYMFSPKVLDRANTFEFRVRTEDFLDQPEKPSRVSPGEPDLVAGFLGILADDRWHIDNPAPDEATFRQHLLTIHRLLSRAGFEFGHRVFYEAVRFAAMLASAGDVDPLHALDRQLMQKILPRLHGSRRRLEATLCGLAVFCHSLAFDEAKGLTDAVAHFNAIEGSGPPRLPISFDKTQRMIEALRANQFVSFTE
jgi:5-methylcytosine-specific restriction protein B